MLKILLNQDGFVLSTELLFLMLSVGILAAITAGILTGVFTEVNEIIQNDLTSIYGGGF